MSAAKRRLSRWSARPDMPDAIEDAYDDDDAPFTITEYLDTAAELIDALRPTNKRWGGQSLRWIFRGHADAVWELVPSALRKSAWRDFKPDYDPDVLTQTERDPVEWEILKQFGDRLDRAGLPIPGKTRVELDRQDPHKLPANWVLVYVELAALAQHHGLPTRLLDFTRSGLIAAYFAALEPPDGAPERFCVWAIDGSFFTLGHGYEEQGTRLALVRGSRAFNVNQHAQDGLLGVWETPSNLGDGKGCVSLLELMDFFRMLAAIPATSTPETPPSPSWTAIVDRLARSETFARKLSVPRSEASELIRLLASERITAATLFPGVRGVVEGMREARRYAIPDHDFWTL